MASDDHRRIGKVLPPEEQRKLSMLAPMWQRIAKGEVDLSEYTDEEILSGRIKMPDGRKAPKPKVYPKTFIDEQIRRGQRVVEREIREGAALAPGVYLAIMKSKKASHKDQMQAAQFFFERAYGKEPIAVKLAHVDKIESLFESILTDPDGLLDPEVP